MHVPVDACDGRDVGEPVAHRESGLLFVVLG